MIERQEWEENRLAIRRAVAAGNLDGAAELALSLLKPASDPSDSRHLFPNPKEFALHLIEGARILFGMEKYGLAVKCIDMALKASNGGDLMGGRSFRRVVAFTATVQKRRKEMEVGGEDMSHEPWARDLLIVAKGKGKRRTADSVEEMRRRLREMRGVVLGSGRKEESVVDVAGDVDERVNL